MTHSPPPPAQHTHTAMPSNARQRRMLPRVLALTLLSVLALTLSGCVSMTMESTFNEDGSARHSLRTTIEKDALQQLEDFTSGFADPDATPEPGAEDESDDPADTFELSDEERQALEDAGFTVEEIDTDEEIGVVISRDFPAGTSLTDAFNELMRANADGDDSDIPLGAIDGFFNRDGDTWTLDLNIDSDRLLESTEEATGADTDDADAEATSEIDIPGFDLESMGIDFDIEYIANFPGTITETNGDRDDDNDNRVTWELPMTGNTTLNALVNANSGGAGGDGRLPWIIGGIVAVALIGVLAAFIIGRNRKQPALATVGAAPAAPPMAGGPMTSAGLPPTYVPQPPPTPDTTTTVSDAPVTPPPSAWAPPTTTGPWNPPPGSSNT